MSAKITVVDRDDNVIGAAPRKQALEGELIHRIVRIFVFNPKGEFYLQKRASNVAFPDLWDQSVGGHVDEGEEYEQAAHREAAEELGLTGLGLKEIATYYSEHDHVDGNRLRRFNRLYRTETADEPRINPDEVAEGRWIAVPELQAWIGRSPDDFTYGFKEAFRKYQELHG